MSEQYNQLAQEGDKGDESRAAPGDKSEEVALASAKPRPEDVDTVPVRPPKGGDVALNKIAPRGPAGRRGGAHMQYQSRAAIRYDDSDSLDDGAEEPEGVEAAKRRIAEERRQAELAQLRAQAAAEKAAQAQAGGGGEEEHQLEPNIKKFKQFEELFKYLTRPKNVVTKYPIVTCMITYNSKNAVTVTKKDDREYYVKMYNLADKTQGFEEKIGGTPTSYIKLKEVEQNAAGDGFAIAYFDDGNFRIRTFGEATRSEADIAAEELDVNKALGLDNHTMPIDNFPDPFITCTFVTDELLYANLHHTPTRTHHSFVYNIKSRQVTSHQKVEMPAKSTKQNFPFKSFYSEEDNEVFSFYRQGQAFRVPIFEVDSPRNAGKPKYFLEQIIDKDLGQMYLVNGKALIARSSSQILFFKQVTDEFTLEKAWQIYWTLNIRGFIYFIKGNKRIQICTDKKIFVYLIDPSTFEPKLENVINNFMGCNQMMFGSKVRYGITYKTNQKSFDIWSRCYEHGFRSTVVNENLNGAIGLAMEKIGAFIVGSLDEVRFYDSETYQEHKCNLIKTPLLANAEKTRERNEIIALQKSACEKMIAVITGKNLIMKQQQVNQLFIYKADINTESSHDHGGHGYSKLVSFELQKRWIVKDIPGFSGFAMDFAFQQWDGRGIDPNTLIFAKQDSLFSFNYETGQMTNIYKFEAALTRQPVFFLLNTDQQVAIVASQNDGIYYNARSKAFVDLDKEFDISNICEMIYEPEDKKFYVLCNKHQERLGLFLIQFDEENPQDKVFILKYKNKLDIGNADIAIINNPAKKLKELLVSYKTIYMNTYTLQVFDIGSDQVSTIFKLETFQLWESKIQGFYLHKNLDYVTINRQGVSVIELGTEHKRVIDDDRGQQQKLHSLESVNYLKIDPKNFIEFSFAGQEKTISVMNPYKVWAQGGGNESADDHFALISKIQIHDITLRELLLFQSLYVCATISDILQLVKDQPEPLVFFKSFLELDCANMVSLLSFDSRSLECLLDLEANKRFFKDEYPIFYKNKVQKQGQKNKFYYRSAIDSALKHNQIRAVQYIVDYMVQWQNNYCSSFLFRKKMCSLMAKGIQISALLDSEIFCHDFDFDEWPSTHTEPESYRRPYNGSLFDLRYSYRQIFHEAKFDAIAEPDRNAPKAEKEDNKKVYKIRYQINMIPMLDEHVTTDANGNKIIANKQMGFMDECIDSDQLEIFAVENFQQLILFKWEGFAKRIHFINFTMHLIYMALLTAYTYNIYIKDLQDKEVVDVLGITLALGVVYPFGYDLHQMYQMGLKAYWSEGSNYFDVIYLWSSIANAIMQSNMPAQHFACKLVMTVIFLIQIVKTMGMLKIFDPLSYIVTMLGNVIFDLRVFLLFYAIMVFLFSQVFNVLGLANSQIRNYTTRKNYFRDLSAYKDQYIVDGEAACLASQEQAHCDDVQFSSPGLPNEEYSKLPEASFGPVFLGNLMSVLRISLGDFDFDAANSLTQEENILFWVIWFIIVCMTCIVFLNFIIAEASESYARVKEKLTEEIFKAKAALVTEAELMYPDWAKTADMLPQYVVIRHMDT